MHELRVATDREVKEVKEDLVHLNTQLDFEVKDKKKEVMMLKQEIKEYEYQLQDIRHHSEKLEIRTKEYQSKYH